MISILFLAALVLSVGGKSLSQKREWRPTFQHTGGLSGYLGGDYTSNNKNWNLGGALHGDLNKPGIVDGGRIHGNYQFNNGLKVNGYLQGQKGTGLEGGLDFKNNNWHLGGKLHGDLNKPGFVDGGQIQGGYQFKNGVTVDGFLQKSKGAGLEGGVGVKIPLGKRSVECATMCYEECEQDNDCLEQCVLTYC